MGVQTGSDLLTGSRVRLRLAQARLLAIALTSARLAPRRLVTVRELLLADGDICNPSITEHGGRLVAAARRPSYRLTGSTLRLDPGTSLGSTTFLLTIDDELGIESSVRVDADAVIDAVGEARDGLEDPRLFTAGGRLLCLWSGLHLGTRGPGRDHGGVDWLPDWSETRNTMVLAELEGPRPISPRVLPSPTGRPREKNWMPFSDQDGLEFVYYLADGAFVTAPSDGALQLRHSGVSEGTARRLRAWSGSSQVVPWHSGRLCVLHLAIRGVPLLSRFRPAVYLHRFALLDDADRVTALSRPFRFRRLEVEFCAGLVARGEDLLLSFGAEDRRAFLARVPVARVDAMLRRVR